MKSEPRAPSWTWILASLVALTVVVSPVEAKGKPACNDGVDNDGDGLVDHGADPGCDARGAMDEENGPAPPPPTSACADGKDNDGDGAIDGQDAGCSGPQDDNEGIEGGVQAPPLPPAPTLHCSILPLGCKPGPWPIEFWLASFEAWTHEATGV